MITKFSNISLDRFFLFVIYNSIMVIGFYDRYTPIYIANVTVLMTIMFMFFLLIVMTVFEQRLKNYYYKYANKIYHVEAINKEDALVKINEIHNNFPMETITIPKEEITFITEKEFLALAQKQYSK